MAPLERAVALAERDDRAVGVAEQLDLDVARRPDLALEVDRAVAERGRAPRADPAARAAGSSLGRDDPPHAPTAAAGRGLDEQREPDALGLRDDRRDLVGPVDRRRLERARDDGHAGRRRASRRAASLSPSAAIVALRRPDEHEPRVLDGPGELRPLGEEAVAGMDRLRPGPGRGVEDRVDPEVALAGRRGPEADRLVGRPGRAPAVASASL